MISGGLAGGSSTKNADGWQIVALFKGAFAGLKDMLDVVVRRYIATAAALEAILGESNDEEIQRKIVEGAKTCKGLSYTQVGKCTGLVVKAYEAAGIYLVKLAEENGIRNPNYVPDLYALSNKLNINNSVRTTNDPLVGDIIFWNYTYDRNNTCLLSDDAQPTHAGIVSKANIDGEGTLSYIHAGSSGVSVNDNKNKMNILMPSDQNKNAIIRNGPKDGCPKDGSIKRSGELFSGFGTIRNQ
jgi:hypothetical protein